MPEEEGRAKEALEMAKTIVDLHKLPSTMKVLRSRVAGQEIVRAADEQGVDMIIIGMKPGMGVALETFSGPWMSSCARLPVRYSSMGH